MKAPDKIYFEIDEKGKVHTYFGLQPDNATEYIRKGALLEYVKARLLQYDPEYSNAGRELQMIVDKLNEM